MSWKEICEFSFHFGSLVRELLARASESKAWLTKRAEKSNSNVSRKNRVSRCPVAFRSFLAWHFRPNVSELFVLNLLREDGTCFDLLLWKFMWSLCTRVCVSVFTCERKTFCKQGERLKPVKNDSPFTYFPSLLFFFIGNFVALADFKSGPLLTIFAAFSCWN